MIFVSMGIAFVNLTGAFPIEGSTGVPINSNDANGTFGDMSKDITTGSSFDFTSLWLIGTATLAGVGSIILATLIRQTTIIAVYLFGTVFWSCWLHMIGIFNIGGFLTSSAALILIGMITLGMMFIFAGAVIGMLGGSVSMR